MRFNWNAIIAAVGYLTDEPSADGPLTGKGYTVTRTGQNSFTVDIERVNFEDEGDATNGGVVPTPENPNPSPAAAPVPAEASESVPDEVTPTATPDVSAEAAPVNTGQGAPEVPAAATGQGTPQTGAVATGQ